jgi:GT2 family glycosyltransferase
MELPVVSVILLNWNGLLDTEECIESLRKASYKNVVIYIVDNASRNNEAAIIAEKYPFTKVLPQSENLGFCKANNLGIEKAIEEGAKYVLILNNDTIVPPDAIEVLVRQFEIIPDAGAASPVIFEYPDVKIGYTHATWDPKTAKFWFVYPSDNYEDISKRKPYPTGFAHGCCLFTSAKILKEVGSLDERYFAFYDEAEWCCRIERYGYKSYVIPDTFIYHKGSKTTPSLVSVYLMTRNRLLWMKENLSFTQRLQSTPYLTKELIWHQCNIWGITRSATYSKQHSRALLRGWKDFHLKKYGKWHKSVEKIIFTNRK